VSGGEADVSETPDWLDRLEARLDRIESRMATKEELAGLGAKVASTAPRRRARSYAVLSEDIFVP
jgi:hypothetical protein